MRCITDDDGALHIFPTGTAGEPCECGQRRYGEDPWPDVPKVEGRGYTDWRFHPL